LRNALIVNRGLDDGSIPEPVDGCAMDLLPRRWCGGRNISHWLRVRGGGWPVPPAKPACRRFLYHLLQGRHQIDHIMVNLSKNVVMARNRFVKTAGTPQPQGGA
jgi:hypothetical protein